MLTEECQWINLNPIQVMNSMTFILNETLKESLVSINEYIISLYHKVEY